MPLLARSRSDGNSPSEDSAGQSKIQQEDTENESKTAGDNTMEDGPGTRQEEAQQDESKTDGDSTMEDGAATEQDARTNDAQ